MPAPDPSNALDCDERERHALEGLLLAGHARSIRGQFAALCELVAEELGWTPAEIHRRVAEKLHEKGPQQ